MEKVDGPPFGVVVFCLYYSVRFILALSKMSTLGKQVPHFDVANSQPGTAPCLFFLPGVLGCTVVYVCVVGFSPDPAIKPMLG